MICSCGTIFRVVSTYPAGDQAQTQRLVCPKCGKVGTVIAKLVNTDPNRGNGAAAIAQKIKRLGYVPSLDEVAESVDGGQDS